MLSLGACGPRLITPHTDDAGPARDVSSMALPPAGECVVAERLGACCSTFVAATRAQVMADPCLYAADVPQTEGVGCDVPLSSDCTRECTPERPPSRAVAMRDGRCVFVDECAQDADCVVAQDCRACCCSDAVSATIARQDECVFAPDEARNDCWNPCPGLCMPWPTASWDDGTSYGMVARCETVASTTGEVKGCVPRPPAWGYLFWQAPSGKASAGPALEIEASGSTRLWRQTIDAHEEPDVVFRLSPAQSDALFSLLSKVSFERLPHPGTYHHECSIRLATQRCRECVTAAIDYRDPSQLRPEFDAVYVWLDEHVAPQARGIAMPASWCVF